MKTEEKKYEQLRKLGQELHIPIPEHFIELEVRDKDGNIIPIKDQHGNPVETLKLRSHSWVRNAYNMFLSQMASKNLDDPSPNYGAGFLNIKETDGTIKDVAYGVAVASSNYEDGTSGYRGLAAAATRGILVGNDATAESFEDFRLLSQIAEGMGAGQLNHMTMAVPTKSYDAPTKTWTITWNRYFNNNSPGVVNVNEVAIYTRGPGAGTTLTFMMTRDKLGATVTIPATGQLKVTYTFQLTFPA